MIGSLGSHVTFNSISFQSPGRCHPSRTRSDGPWAWFPLGIPRSAPAIGGSSGIHPYGMPFENVCILLEINISHLGKLGKSSSKCHFWGDMLVPWRVSLWESHFQIVDVNWISQISWQWYYLEKLFSERSCWCFSSMICVSKLGSVCLK